jgi:ATP-dependent DNA helicase RecG
MAALRRRRTLSAPQIHHTLQRDLEATQRVLERMQEQQLVEPTRASARRQFPSYRLTASSRSALRGALAYRIESIDSDDAKLIRHLKRHRRISNQEVRDYLDCDVSTARNRLQRMRQKGWIDFPASGPKRGPNVEYEALPAVDQL